MRQPWASDSDAAMKAANTVATRRSRHRSIDRFVKCEIKGFYAHFAMNMKRSHRSFLCGACLLRQASEDSDTECAEVTLEEPEPAEASPASRWTKDDPHVLQRRKASWASCLQSRRPVLDNSCCNSKHIATTGCCSKVFLRF
jgi:hypothetical protein